MKNKFLFLTALASVSLSAQLYSPNGAPATSNSSTGNVGIGVQSPITKLHVGGDINSTGNNTLNIGFNLHDKANGVANYGMSYLGIGGGLFGPGVGYPAIMV